jgi:hypothetical protein
MVNSIFDDPDKLPRNSIIETMVEHICRQTQSNNRHFFRLLTTYYVCKMASMQRAYVRTLDRGPIPINMYCLNLATSGDGKGHATNIIEENIIHLFQDEYINRTFPAISNASLDALAAHRAIRNDREETIERGELNTEFVGTGPLLFSFDSGTIPALKQQRHKLLMAGTGSINLEVDEIGANLLANTDMLTAFFELFDVGKIKQKLIKNTAESSRSEEIHGRTPTNAMLYGAPDAIFDGDKTEAQLKAFFESGYARRCFYGYSDVSSRNTDLTAEEIFANLTSSSSATSVDQIATLFGSLGAEHNHGIEMKISKDNSILSIQYQMHCEARAKELGPYDNLRKAEVTHRFFKALKIAGAYAFILEEREITEEILLSAIRLAEESGEKFNRMLNQDRNYVKLAKYLASIPGEVTGVDIMEALPFFKGSNPVKKDLIESATAWGYKNNILVKRSYEDGIEFFEGETLEETNLDEVTVSYSQDISVGYRNEKIPFRSAHQLFTTNGFHWCNHYLANQHRSDENIIEGFNLIVFDIDHVTTLVEAREVLKDYEYMLYTTKRHTPDENRFRIVMPMSHMLKMDADVYREFMANIMEWFPYPSDEQVNQRARKWASFGGNYEYNEGKLIDVLPFIPRTPKNEERKKVVTDLQSLTNLERWFVTNTGRGNRSNNLHRYAMMLVDSGYDLASVEAAVVELNSKLQSKLSDQELQSTIMVSVRKKIV